MCNACLRSGGGGLLGGVLGTSFVSARESKIGVNEGHILWTLFSLIVGDTYVAALEQEDVMCNGKEPVEVWG